MTGHGYAPWRTDTSDHDLDGVYVADFLSDGEIKDAATVLARLAGVSTQTAERHLRNATGAELERLDNGIGALGGDIRVVPTDGNDTIDAAEPDTACPECGNTQTVGFSTGDRVCKKCNENFIPGEGR